MTRQKFHLVCLAIILTNAFFTANILIGATFTSDVFHAVASNDLDKLQAVLRSGVDIDVRESRTSFTPLMFSAKLGRDEIANFLLQSGANINERDSGGRTSLMIASQYGNAKTVEILLHWGASVDEKATFGDTPLMFAVAAGNSEVVATLLKHGAAVNSKNKSGSTPLFIAANQGSEAIVRMLLTHGADAAGNIESNRNPIAAAQVNGHAEALTLLLGRTFKVKLLALAILGFSIWPLARLKYGKDQSFRIVKAIFLSELTLFTIIIVLVTVQQQTNLMRGFVLSYLILYPVAAICAILAVIFFFSAVIRKTQRNRSLS